MVLAHQLLVQEHATTLLHNLCTRTLRYSSTRIVVVPSWYVQSAACWSGVANNSH